MSDRESYAPQAGWQGVQDWHLASTKRSGAMPKHGAATALLGGFAVTKAGNAPYINVAAATTALAGALLPGDKALLDALRSGDFTLAQHTHQNTAGGGTLDAAAITAGTLALGRATVGRAPYALPPGQGFNDIFTTVRTLAAAGGSTLVPILIPAWMFVQSVTIHNLNVATARSWEWRLYAEPDGGSATANEVANMNGGETFTPGAASNRTVSAGTPGLVAPGSYWLAIRCSHATNSFDIGTGATGTLSTNHSRIKSGLGALGATLDISTGWTPSTVFVGARINGRVAGEAAAF